MKLDDVTVFIISTGEETAKDCLEALNNQDCSFKIEHIEDVYPMNAAFQEMPNRSKTPFFVQVDADMILHPFAVRTLYEAIKNSAIFSQIAFGQLYEEGFGVGGSVRIWKKQLFKIFKFNDCRTVDRNLYQRIRLLGIRRKNVKKVLGIHRPRHSNFSDYLKTKSDIEKWRFLGRHSKLYAEDLFDEIVEDLPGKKHQFFGMLLGVLTGSERIKRSKDWQVEKQRFDDVIKEFGYSPEEQLQCTHQNDSDLRQLFINCYQDFTTNDIASRERLINRVIDFFSKTEQTDPRKLLEIVTR
jgi:hypothetical protein